MFQKIIKISLIGLMFLCGVASATAEENATVEKQFSQTIVSDNALFHVSATEGSLPEGSVFRAEEKKDTAELGAIPALPGVLDSDEVHIFNLFFALGEQTVTPQEEVKITVDVSSWSSADVQYQIFHQRPGGVWEQMEVELQERNLHFLSASFSNYALLIRRNLLPVALGDARIGTTTYPTLSAAVAAANSGEVIVLLRDVDSITAPILVKDKEITLDFAGYRIKRDAYLGKMFTVDTNASLILENGTLDGGSDWSYQYSVKTENGYAPEKIVVTADANAKVGQDTLLENKGSLVFRKMNIRNFIQQNHPLILNTAGKLYFEDSSVDHVWAKNGTGGVVRSVNGEVRSRRTAFTHNGIGGNGVMASDGVFQLRKTNFYVSESSFIRNFAGSNSAAFGLTDVKEAEVIGTVFEENVCGNDGAVTEVAIIEEDTLDSVVFQGCKFHKNIGLAQGNQGLGAVLYVSTHKNNAKQSIGLVLFEDCVFTQNESSMGIVHNWATPWTKIRINRCTFEANKNGVLVVANALITNSKFQRNIAKQGSVLYVTASDNTLDDTAEVFFQNTVIEENESTNDKGTGALTITRGRLVIGDKTVIRDNYAAGYAGGLAVYAEAKSLAIEEGAKIYRNRAERGGDDMFIAARNKGLIVTKMPEAATMGVEDRDYYPVEGYYRDIENATLSRFNHADDDIEYKVSRITNNDGSVKSMYIRVSAKKRTITYDLNGGSFAGNTANVIVKERKGAQIAILSAPSREGYNFIRWEAPVYNPGDLYTVDDDHTFKAVWEKKNTSSAPIAKRKVVNTAVK